MPVTPLSRFQHFYGNRAIFNGEKTSPDKRLQHLVDDFHTILREEAHPRTPGVAGRKTRAFYPFNFHLSRRAVRSAGAGGFLSRFQRPGAIQVTDILMEGEE